MKKLEEKMKALLDREAIRELPARYCDCVWRNDIPAIVNLFAPEGEFAMSTADKTWSAKGHDALLEFYARGLAMTPRPFIHNVVVTLSEEKGRAEGRSYVELRSLRNGMEWLGAGSYIDHYVKIKGEWKFARREFTALRLLDEPAAPVVKPVVKAKRASGKKPPARKKATRKKA